MIIKKFQAESENAAVLLAKKELGKDAIVMNIKKITPKGIYRIFKKPTVEVTAAIDDDMPNQNKSNVFAQIQEIANKSLQNEPKEAKILDRSKLKDIIVEEEPQEDTSAIEQKLDSLQDLLEKQIISKPEENSEEPAKENEEEDKTKVYLDLILKKLVDNEVDEKYAGQIIREIEKSINKDTALDNILASIYQKIILKIGQPKIIENKKGKQKIVFFIGPTGVGKTTTIAKIASCFKVADKAKIALVTSDTYRIAAVEQLRTYANILGVPLRVVYNEEEMKQAKKEFSAYDLILVDTAGRSHKNREQRDDIEKLIHAVNPEQREIYLVLSATTKYKDLVKITQAYSELGEYRIIFTKLDETGCIGNLLNVKMLTNKPLAYATWGQNVPDDIGKIDAQAIAKQLLGGQ